MSDSKKIRAVLSHLFAAKNRKELTAFVTKLKLSDPDSEAREILASVIFILVKHLKETEQLLGRQNHEWLTKDTTDLEGFLKVLRSHHWFGTDPITKNVAQFATDSRKLLNKLRLITNGKVHKKRTSGGG